MSDTGGGVVNPAPGWYPDPGGTAPYRWWDGRAWTGATSNGAAPAAQPAAMQSAAPQSAPTQPVVTPRAAAVTAPVSPTAPAATDQPVPFGTPTESPFGAGAVGGQQSPATAYGTKSPFDSEGNPIGLSGQRRVVRNAPTGSGWQQNTYAIWTFASTALAVILAIIAGFAFIVIGPIILCVASRQRREPLAPMAIVAAVVCVVIGINSFAHFA